MRTTVFGAGAMGTALAMHLARNGNEAVLWASPYDEAVLPALTGRRMHPALSVPLPESLAVLGPDELREAADGIELAVMGAHSGGARSLARIVMEQCGELPTVVSVAKGLEAGTGKRMSRVYAEEVGHRQVVAVGGPCLAPEVAKDLPTSSVFASEQADVAARSSEAFASPTYTVTVTDDVVGVEYCTLVKNVGAIGMGILDGLGKTSSADYRNAKAALFTQAIGELVELVTILGGRAETAYGLAGVGDTLVTSLGGRNRLYGELIGEGAEPVAALKDLEGRNMTVEGVESARDVARLAGEHGLSLPVHLRVCQILFDGVPAASLLDSLRG